MAKRLLVVTVCLLLAVLAGCLQAGEDPRAGPQSAEDQLTPPVPLETVVDQTHDHEDAKMHDASWNIEQLGHHTGFQDPGDAEALQEKFGFHGFAVDPPYAYLCRGGENPGLVVVDFSDLESPAFVAIVEIPLCNDAEVSEDGRWVFAGTQRNTVEDVAQASELGPASAPRGTYVVDVADPAEPEIESFFALPYNGPHTLTTHTTDDDRLLVLHQTYDLYGTLDPTGQAPLPSPGGAAPGSHRSIVTELVQAPDGTHELERIGAYSATGQTLQNPDEQIIIHDAIVADNPLDGHTYLLVAYWDLGVHILDFEEPTQPALIATFEDFSPSAFANIHQVRAFPDAIDGRWVLAAQPEIGTAEESGQITFIDASEPSQPEKLGHWTLPGNVSITEPYLFSPHNFDVDENGRLFLGHFHAGVWALSVDNPGSLIQPVTTGFIEPMATAHPELGGPMTWGVELHDDTLYAMDSANGVHALNYTGP